MEQTSFDFEERKDNDDRKEVVEEAPVKPEVHDNYLEDRENSCPRCGNYKPADKRVCVNCGG